MILSFTLFIIGLVIAYFPFYRLKKDDPLKFYETILFFIVATWFITASLTDVYGLI